MISISILILLSYIFILFILSAYFVKRALISYEEYAFCGRQLTIWFIILTYFGTWIGGGTIIGLIGGAYEDGAGPYWIFAMSCLFGYGFAIFFLPRVRKMNLKSIGDFFAVRFPEKQEAVRIPVFVAVMARNVTILGMQFAALAYLFTFVFEIDKNLSILVTFLLITSYTSLSGLWAVISTDVFQGIFQLVGMVLLLYFSSTSVGGLGEILDSNSMKDFFGGDFSTPLLPFELTPIALIVCFGLFFLMGDLVDWERTYSSKSLSTAFWGYLIPLTITLILLVLPTITGLLLQEKKDLGIPEEYITYWFLLEEVPDVIGILILCTLFAAIMSSADSYMIASGTMFANDIIKKFVNREATDREMVFWSRLGVVLFGSVGYAFAININNIFLLWALGIAGATITLLPVYGMAWFSKRMDTLGAMAGMLSGLVYCGVIIYTGNVFHPIAVIGGMFLNTMTAVTVCMITGGNKEEISRALYFSSHTLSE